MARTLEFYSFTSDIDHKTLLHTGLPNFIPKLVVGRVRDQAHKYVSRPPSRWLYSTLRPRCLGLW
jgi:hypothetical protein